jgi:hypothetical protein
VEKVAQESRRKQKASRAGLAKCLIIWRARQESNPRPPGSQGLVQNIYHLLSVAYDACLTPSLAMFSRA